MSAQLHFGEAAFGPALMKFAISYDGELRANGKPAHKQRIREQISPQLEELWQVSPALRYVTNYPWVPRKSGFGRPVIHHTAERDTPAAKPPADGDWLDVRAPVEVKEHKFIPLVRDSLALLCGLKITYFRKEDPGRLVYQGGDIDNRLKTLFDALAVPNEDQLVGAPPQAPLYCLLEDDKLISGFNIETHRLLTRPGANHHEVRLIIEVDVRVSRARAYNQVFLGD